MRSEPTRSARSQRTQHVVAALVPAIILLLSVTGFVWAQKRVTVVVEVVGPDRPGDIITKPDTLSAAEKTGCDLVEAVRAAR